MTVTLNVFKKTLFGHKLVCVCGFLNVDAALLAINRSEHQTSPFKVYDLTGAVVAESRKEERRSPLS